ncbi:MAG: hypothetical protein IKH73_03070 [Erysipelotrichaceae bacterium]|nr:hypothetical protein [Erysipelotrichaceae bacterium]
MASIAYISDSNMLEFHRLNGNKTIVFWRISNKNFSAFNAGDLLFFLSKDQQMSRRNEKGIVGCGSYIGNSTITINRMWNQYHEATGYGSLKALKEAVLKSSKTEELPKQINCLKLQHVVFFQSPIYLSEVGMKISNNLESFTYLDRGEGSTTLKLLSKARAIGPDSWSSAINNYDFFDSQILFYQLTTIYEQNRIAEEYHDRRLSKKADSRFKDLMWLNRQKQSFLRFDKGNKIYYLFSSPQKQQEENFYRMCGELDYLKYVLRDIQRVSLTVLTDNLLSESQKEYLIARNIQLEDFSD